MKQNTIRTFINRNVERQLVREYLLKETERAGYGGLVFNRTPEGTKVTLSAEQVGRVIGRRGKVMEDWLKKPDLLSADSNAQYSETIEINLNELKEPVLACPNDPDNVKLLNEVAGTPIQEVFIGS